MTLHPHFGHSARIGRPTASGTVSAGVLHRSLSPLPRLAAGLVLAVSFGGGAEAHQAPTGWTYDASCCSGRDCAPVPADRVTAGPDGWRIKLLPGDNDMAPMGADILVPYDDRRIRRSKDEDFHPCISATGKLLCLYTPLMGM